MKFFSTTRETKTNSVSDNCVWSSKTTTVYRTIFGVKVWELKSITRVYKLGEPYIAKL